MTEAPEGRHTRGTRANDGGIQKPRAELHSYVAPPGLTGSQIASRGLRPWLNYDVAHNVAYSAVTFDSLIPRERLKGRSTK